eukprot:gene1339-780_t
MHDQTNNLPLDVNATAGPTIIFVFLPVTRRLTETTVATTAIKEWERTRMTTTAK